MNETEKETGGEFEFLLRTEILERFIARFIDFLIAGALYFLPSVIGPLSAATYLLISDGLMQGRSVGKKLIGLRTVMAAEPAFPCDFVKSIVRNALFGALVISYSLLGLIPYIGKLTVFVAAALVVVAEAALIYTDESGQRFGDRLAGTLVVNEKD